MVVIDIFITIIITKIYNPIDQFSVNTLYLKS